MIAFHVVFVQQASAAPSVPPVPSPPSDVQISERAQGSPVSAKVVTTSRGEIRITGPDGQIITIPRGAMPVIAGTGIQSGPFDHIIPPAVENMTYAFFAMLAIIVIGWPLARAFGRRIERRGETVAIAPAVSDQLARIEQAVDAMSVEIERISESQRFMAKLQQGSTAERV